MLIVGGGNAVEIWTLTVDEFLTKDLQQTGSTAASFEMFLPLLEEPGWHRGREVPMDGKPGFATAPAKRPGMDADLAYQVLLKKDGDQWELVGLYIDDTIIVKPEMRGAGLTTELVLLCAKYRPLPSRRTVSPAGLATLKRAHRIGVERALAEGLPVPANVRAEYKL